MFDIKTLIDVAGWVRFVCRKRGKKGEKNGKGLRHFSMKVCEKVQKKGVTTYNEVADELVAEFSSSDNHMSPNDSVSAHAVWHCHRRMQVAEKEWTYICV